MCIHHTDAVAITEQIYGHTIGPIVWDDVQCDGTESNLTECRRSEVRVHNCELNQGVAVSCSCPGKHVIYIYYSLSTGKDHKSIAMQYCHE